MEKVIYYDVTLSNNDCIFDSCENFESAEEALEWADGRGGNYVMQISDSRGNNFNIKSADTTRGMRYRIFRGWGWQDLSRADVIAELK